ncbi:MAG: VOC family protein, partial [Xanthobacteraceae bacterium]
MPRHDRWSSASRNTSRHRTGTRAVTAAVALNGGLRYANPPYGDIFQRPAPVEASSHAMVQVRRLGHATLTTPDLDRAVDYYTQVIGLTVV